MKWIIASDIHGSAYYCKKLLEKIQKENISKVLLLGDLLYHGPRNELPKDYNPKQVIKMLNTIAEKIICVRGNCDSEVDQMVLDFPIMADYAILNFEKTTIYATHGHLYNEKKPLKLFKNDILICGHFHVPCIKKIDEWIYLNDGSLSLPKENTWHNYTKFDGSTFTWHDIETDEIKLKYPIYS